ncbi:hypothetical protein PRIPAC_87406, partial [Pristionchus pacificus]|uniref:Uncharacterized protein n=1 Tax=Pristionchus pacificus TaxID=54126 RepID=A0A8R1YMN9_PRIPA
HPKKPTVPSTPPTGSHPMRDTVRQLGVRSPSRPSHIRFTSESPTNPAALPSPAKSFDNGREENSEGEETRRIGRMQRDSSPEVSTTSSESDDDDNGKEVDRKKKLTKRKEVTSSKMTPSKMTSIKLKLQEKSPKDTTMTSSEKKKDKKKSEEVKENIVTKPEKASSKEPRLRPSPDLLQMVAERLANGHGLLVFREICRETRRIAERQRRAADSVLHLEEFDDENAFTRDDMTAWWEERREVEDTMVREGKENRVHSQISEYLKERAVEKNLLRDMDGGVSHPSCAASAVDPLQLLQHPLETLDAACLLHGSQAGAAARLLQQEGRGMREVWLGHCSAKLVRELKYLKSIERFEHRKATMQTLENLPLLQITELRLDMIDDLVTRSALSDHLVNAQNLRALELNIAPTGPIDGNTSSHYSLFTKRSYDRGDYTEDLDWMIPNVEEGEPDPVTLCMPSLEHLATNVANAKLFWQLRDSTLLLRHLLSLRVGTLSKTKELIASSELFADTKESRRYKQPGFFALRDAYETVLESVTLRLADRVGMCRLQQETATIFEAIAELPPSLRRLSISLFYNQFSGVCAPFRKWAEPGVEAPDTDHIGIEEMHLHFERAFDLRGLPALLPRSIKTLSIALNYETDDDAKCLGPFLEMLPGFARLENLEDLHIQVWGVRCLEQLVAALSSSSILALRLTRLAVAAYPMDDRFFEPAVASSWLRSSLSAFPRVRTIGLHATVLTRLIPEERRSGYSWRNGVAWLANEMIGGCVGRKKEDKNGRNLDEVSLTASSALPMLDDGEEYTITPHWQVEFDATQLVLSPEDEEEREEVEDASYSIPHGADSDDSFLTDGEDEEDHAGEASRDDLELMEEGLEDETERIERRESRRDEKVRAAMERGEMVEHEEEEEGDVIDFDRISDQEDDEEHQPRSEFFDDEAVESDREESEEEENGKHEESADSDCSSEDDDKEREEERMKEEGRKQKRMERKQAKLENEVVRCKRKRAFDSDEEEEEIVIRVRAPSKKKRVVIDSDDE